MQQDKKQLSSKRKISQILKDQVKKTDSKTNYLQDFFPDCEFQIDQNWHLYLKQHGVVVVKNCLDPGEIEKARSLFWDKLQSLSINPKKGIKRDDISSWKQYNWPAIKPGFANSWGLCHSEACWFIRTHPNIMGSFAKIWNTTDLLSSFDAIIAWRPWWHSSKVTEGKENWKPQTQGLHCDQNPYYKKGYHCVQGMVPLYDVDEDVGGLEVIADTHTDQVQSQLRKRYPETMHFPSDWVPLSRKDQMVGHGKLIKAKAGSLILWDSRIIHGGIVGKGKTILDDHEAGKCELARLSFTVSMTEKSRADKHTIQNRIDAFNCGSSTNHWAHEYHSSGFMKGGCKGLIKPDEYQHVPLKITPQMKQLIGM